MAQLVILTLTLEEAKALMNVLPPLDSMNSQPNYSKALQKLIREIERAEKRPT